MNLGEKIISYVVLIIAIIVGLKFLPSIPISSVVTQKQSDFTVSGTGKVSAIPDTAIVSLGVQITKNTIKSAKDEANSIVSKTIETLKQIGVESKDIKTENYSINPNYDWSSGRGRITGYLVSQSLIVTVRDLEKVNDVIDQTASLGLNNIGNIQLSVNEQKLKELQAQAREEAVKEAKIKAENLSRAADMKLGRIINIVESEPFSPRPFLMADSKMGMGGGGMPEASNIQPGSTDITSTVTLTYETR